jgi:glyoxylase-like metal-dependent hydrolase (beta-lactamase superfamily II)
MHILKKHTWQDVEGWQMGFGPVGPPLMSVFFYRIGALLVDTGQKNMQRHVLAALSDRWPETVVLTHHHEDHSGNAAAIAQRGARVLGHRLTAKKMARPFAIRPYQYLIWGKAAPLAVAPVESRIEDGRFSLEPIHTPGHSPDHTVYLEANRGWIFSGDLYLGDRIKFFRADENIIDQIASLKHVLTLDFDALFCAHRPAAAKGKKHLAAKLAFLEEVCGQVRRLVDMGCGPAEVIARMANGQDRKVFWITLGNASHANMIRSALRAADSKIDGTTATLPF